MDNNSQHPRTDAVGFCLLPSELIQNILLNLALPDIYRLKLLSKSIAHLISDPLFVQECNTRSRKSPWIFVYKKKWRQDATLHGFTDQSNSWYDIPVNKILQPIIHPGEDLYFLTASGNVFLFASNSNQEVIAVNLVHKTVKKIPPSPLGRRGTSSWRRSGMKLIAGPNGSDHFRFLFAELVGNIPILFQYDSRANLWQSMEAREHVEFLPRVNDGHGDFIFLSVINGPSVSIVLAIGPSSNEPIVLRPRFDLGTNNEGQQLVIGLGWGKQIDLLQVYGDGFVMVVRSEAVSNGVNSRVRILKGIEIWGLSPNGRCWECMSSIPSGLLENIKKPYGVMMGCLEGKDGVVRAVLISNIDGVWNLVWLSYNMQKDQWKYNQLPDCRMRGSNLAGIAFSSGLTM